MKSAKTILLGCRRLGLVYIPASMNQCINEGTEIP